MRPFLVMILLCVGCHDATPKSNANSGQNDDAADASGDDDASTLTDGSIRDDGGNGGSSDVDTSDDLSSTADGSPVDPAAYREPDAIRGGACDPEATADACRGDTPRAVYCSLDDPSRVVMAVCLSTSRGNQCEAMDDCGAGWSACTATQYVERGGRDVEPNFSTTNRAWLAACVQDAGGQTLRNEPCAPCTDFDPAYDPAVMWWCEDGSVVYEGGMDGDRLGVVTSPECFRVGENAPDNGAWWALDFAGSGPPFVVCCDDEF